jgi:putative serine protease PepD
MSQNITLLGGGLAQSAQRIDTTNMLISRLSDEISRVGEESRAGISGIRSELNYTGTIDTALDSVVLIIWTDKASVVGSGFIVSETGHILTADHVVEMFGSKAVRAKTRDGNIYIVSVLGRDAGRDVAVLQLPGNASEGLPHMEFSSSGSLSAGSKVFALGAPEGFPFSATEGIVSAVRRVDVIEGEVGVELDLDYDVRVVQTDAAITRGNSGGPLIDGGGRVVGLNSFGVSTSEEGIYLDVEGLNFAISSDDVGGVYTQVLTSQAATAQ